MDQNKILDVYGRGLMKKKERVFADIDEKL
jgi:hypothetical protein